MKNPLLTTKWAEYALTVVFTILAICFFFDVWGHVEIPIKEDPTPGVFTNSTTVRLSVMELKKMEADTSSLDCYACHKKGETGELNYNDHGQLVLPEDHRDLIYSRMNCVACHEESEAYEIQWDDDGNTIIPAAHQNLNLRHGDNQRNNNCFNCHVAENLATLKTSTGRIVTFSQANMLCAGCHGPTYRDWEAGIHGRLNGYWDQSKGERVRKDCTSCHDPHLPAFPKMIPGPAPFQPTAHAQPLSLKEAHANEP